MVHILIDNKKTAVRKDSLHTESSFSSSSLKILRIWRVMLLRVVLNNSLIFQTASSFVAKRDMSRMPISLLQFSSLCP